MQLSELKYDPKEPFDDLILRGSSYLKTMATALTEWMGSFSFQEYEDETDDMALNLAHLIYEFSFELHDTLRRLKKESDAHQDCISPSNQEEPEPSSPAGMRVFSEEMSKSVRETLKTKAPDLADLDIG